MKSKNLMKVSLASLLLASPILEASAFTVTIDSGHGHNTPGKRAVDDSFREWDINDRVAKLTFIKFLLFISINLLFFISFTL